MMLVAASQRVEEAASDMASVRLVASKAATAEISIEYENDLCHFADVAYTCWPAE
jgi:hypothetical protein